LIVSVVFVLMTVILREQRPQLSWLNSTEDREVFRPADKYDGLLSTEDSHVKVLKFSCPLHFANVETYSDAIADHLAAVAATPDKVTIGQSVNGATNGGITSVDKSNGVEANVLILDGGAIPYIDSMGIEALQTAFAEGEKAGVRVLFADFSDFILDSLSRSAFFTRVPKTNFYPSVREALISTENLVASDSTTHKRPDGRPGTE